MRNKPIFSLPNFSINAKNIEQLLLELNEGKTEPHFTAGTILRVIYPVPDTKEFEILLRRDRKHWLTLILTEESGILTIDRLLEVTSIAAVAFSRATSSLRGVVDQLDMLLEDGWRRTFNPNSVQPNLHLREYLG